MWLPTPCRPETREPAERIGVALTEINIDRLVRRGEPEADKLGG